jgi:hypothetical protein
MQLLGIFPAPILALLAAYTGLLPARRVLLTLSLQIKWVRTDVVQTPISSLWLCLQLEIHFLA